MSVAAGARNVRLTERRNVRTETHSRSGFGRFECVERASQCPLAPKWTSPKWDFITICFLMTFLFRGHSRFRNRIGL